MTSGVTHKTIEVYKSETTLRKLENQIATLQHNFREIMINIKLLNKRLNDLESNKGFFVKDGLNEGGRNRRKR